MKLGILASHPIQYQAPLFRELARKVDLMVYFAHRQTPEGQAQAGFNVGFEWDADLLGGYEHQFLHNCSRHPDVGRFFGCDTPEIAGEIHRGGFDAFLVMGWYLKSFWQAMRACKKHGVPVMVRGDSQLGTPRSRLKHAAKEVVYPWILRQFDACLYVGKRNHDYLEHYGVPAERLFFSPHCIDTATFSAQARAVNRMESRARLNVPLVQKAVLFVGKLMEIKRPLDVIRSLHVLRGRGVDAFAVIVGDGPLRTSVQACAEELGIPIVSLGFRNQSELPEIYSLVDVLALTSITETWGLVVNEALACGTPVVVSDAVGCAPDLVREGLTGASFPVGSVQGLAEALQRVLESPPPEAGIREISESYSVSAAAKGVLHAMEWLRYASKGSRE